MTASRKQGNNKLALEGGIACGKSQILIVPATGVDAAGNVTAGAPAGAQFAGDGKTTPFPSVAFADKTDTITETTLIYTFF